MTPASVCEVTVYSCSLTFVTAPAFCEMLNAEGVPAPGKWRPNERRPRSGKWANASVLAVLKNPMTWGEYRYGVTETVKVCAAETLTFGATFEPSSESVTEIVALPCVLAAVLKVRVPVAGSMLGA